MMNRRTGTFLALALALSSIACAGDADWLRGLQGKPTTTRGDVLLAAALFADDAGWRQDHAWALKSAEQRGWVRGDQTHDMTGTATRGYACSVFARALRLRGGVLMRLTGQSGRYAYRELRLHGLIPDGPSHLKLTGDELVGLLDGATKLRENGRTRPPGI